MLHSKDGVLRVMNRFGFPPKVPPKGLVFPFFFRQSSLEPLNSCERAVIGRRKKNPVNFYIGDSGIMLEISFDLASATFDIPSKPENPKPFVSQ